MEVALSAVTGELVSRFISFLMNKYYSSRSCKEKQVEMLQQLLARVHTVVEEADGRYITNSGMLMKLKMLSEAMYQGYRVLDAMRYQSLEKSCTDEVSDSSRTSLPFASPFKRSRIISGRRNNKITHGDLHGALESLEIAVANMAEFVVLLSTCERMSRRPYDAYLYIDNVMFGRHTEKQKLLSFLLQYDPPGNAPAVLPIIGGIAVGKKSLVAHVCGDERVRLRFSSVLHLNGDNLLRILEHGKAMLGMLLVVVEFVSDVDDEAWKKFHIFITRMGRGSKVIIISRLKRLARFGSAKPICLNALSYDELRYLFKILAFGSTDPIEHPKLVQIADEFVKEFHMGGSLATTNIYANICRRNLNVRFWLCILNKARRMIERNLSIYGTHPNLLSSIAEGHPLDITDLALQPFRFITSHVQMKKELPSMTVWELLTDPSSIPKGEFNLLSWESRIPPYTSFVNCVQVMPEGTPFSGKKRRGVPI